MSAEPKGYSVGVAEWTDGRNLVAIELISVGRMAVTPRFAEAMAMALLDAAKQCREFDSTEAAAKVGAA